VKIGALIGWMNSQKMSAAAVAWMKTLPPTLLVKRTTPLNLAAKDPINAEKTLRVLYDFYASRRDTQELYRVLVHLEKVRPTDRSVRNNLAQISLLLNLNPDQAYRAAREVYEQEPKNPDYAAPYAFSLYLQGDVKKRYKRLLVFPKRSWNDRKLPRTTAPSWRTLVIFRARRNFLIWAKKRICCRRSKSSSRRRSWRLHGVSLVVRGGTYFARLDRFL